jgi:hypothetical protein
MDPVHGLVGHAGVASPRFHHGLHSGRWQGLTGARPNGHSDARWLIGDGAMEKGARGKSVSSLTGTRAAVWQSDDELEQAAVAALGAGSAWAREEEKESGRRCGEGRWGSPLL